MTTALLEIEQAGTRAEDAAVILDLMQRAFAEYKGVLDPPSGVHKETVETVREHMQTGTWVFAKAEGTPVGCVYFEPRDEFVYLGRLSVPPEFRGRGIAEALMDYVEEHARRMGMRSVQLGTRLALEGIRKKYERRGYTIIRYETHPGYAVPTYVTMEKVVGMQNTAI